MEMENMRKYSLRPDLRLRRVGSHYMVVDAGGGTANYADVFTLNESAARLWQFLEAGALDAGELSERLAASYGKAPADVAADVDAQLSQWADFGIVVCQ